jgi:hypothetical protein
LRGPTVWLLTLGAPDTRREHTAAGPLSRPVQSRRHRKAAFVLGTEIGETTRCPNTNPFGKHTRSKVGASYLMEHLEVTHAGIPA